MKRKGITVILLITAFVVLFYGYRYLRIPVNTQMAKITQIEQIITGDAYVAREEVVHTSENSGTMYAYVNDGARVSKNMRIATVFNGEINTEIVSELNNIDKKISELRKEQEKNDKFTTDKSSIQSKLEALKNNIISAALNEEISKITDYKNSINALYDSEDGGYWEKIQELSNRKTKIEEALGNNKSDIYSSISGVFSKNVDGLEDILTPESVVIYTMGDFANLIPPEETHEISNNASFGEKICKVVDNHVWYAITAIPRERAEEIRNKKEVLVRFESLPGAEVSATVEYISEEPAEEENVVVVLKSDRYLDGVYGIRYSKMDIIVNRYTGFEIPIYSLRVVSGDKGVMVAKGSTEVFCKCDIVNTDNEKGTLIVYPSDDAKVKLSVGDKIIIGEKTEE